MVGQTLAHYEIIEKIGEGGMGQVYRARDGKLGREVALKILPKELSGDVERTMRFEREARTLASLQHANVASVYGYEEVDGVRFLVMELVEGEDLSQRLQRGPIPLDEAVEVALQIAAGLEAAHEQGIVHRDLKPANVKLSPTGEVKVLDFGLARAYLGDPTGESDIENSPTITAAMTGAGTILGTAAYMSPEQARGKAVDARSDLWAFGVILYEMLTGQRLFAGETVSDTLAAVLRADADMGALPARTTPNLRRLLRRCLQRDPKLRMRSAGDASLELLEKERGGAEAAAATGRPVVLWSLIAALIIALGFSLLSRPGSDSKPRSVHLDIAPPGGLELRAFPPALSPDGRWLAYVTVDSIGRETAQLRSLERHTTDAITTDAIGEVFDAVPYGATFFFWSPDSRYLGMQNRGSLSSLDMQTRSVQNIFETQGSSRGASWSSNGEIIFAPNANTPILAIPSTGGTPRAVTTVDTSLADTSHRWPVFLPDGHRFLFTGWSNSTIERETMGGIYLGSLDGDEPRRLLTDASMAVLDPNGRILFHRGGKLMQVGIDLETGELRGAPSLVVDDVSWDTNNAMVMASASAAGDLVYAIGELSGAHTLGWLRPNETIEPLIEAPGYLFQLELSTDERFAAVERLTVDASIEIWIADLERRTLSRLSRGSTDTRVGRFSPDGSRVTFTVQHPGSERVYVSSIDGATPPEKLLDLDELFVRVTDWSDDGRLLFLSHVARRTDLPMVSVFDFETKETRVLLQDEFEQDNADLSPDGKWLAYSSTESGRSEIYVRPYPELNRKWQVSVDGGSRPRWHEDGSRLSFTSPPASSQTVDVTTEDGEFRASTPRLIRRFRTQFAGIDISADHSRYLVALRDRGDEASTYRYVTNWASGIEDGAN